MHSSNHTEHYRKKNLYISHAGNVTSLQTNWNTSVTPHKQGTVNFRHRKQLSRSTANCSVSVSIGVPFVRYDDETYK